MILIPIDQEGHSLLTSHVHNLDGVPRRRHRVDGVRNFRASADELLTGERVLAHEMPKALSAEPHLRVQSSDIVKKRLDVGD